MDIIGYTGKGLFLYGRRTLFVDISGGKGREFLCFRRLGEGI